MKWLSKLLEGREYKPTSLAPGPDDILESPLQALDWAAFESNLLELLRTDLAEFAALHVDEVFYSVAIDCNAAYGDILLSANSLSALAEAAATYAGDRGAKALAQQEKILRWGFGDWKYHGFNLSGPEANERYRALLPSIDEITHPHDQEAFLQAVAGALVRLEASAEMGLLAKTDDFQIACADHDESAAVGKRRLARARKVAV